MEELVRNPGDNGSEVNREGEREKSVGGLHPSSALLAHESRGGGGGGRAGNTRLPRDKHS